MLRSEEGAQVDDKSVWGDIVRHFCGRKYTYEWEPPERQWSRVTQHMERAEEKKRQG